MRKTPLNPQNLSQIFTIFVTKIRVIIPEVIEKLTLNKIKKARRGSLFFIEDFITKASNDASRKALERFPQVYMR